MAEQTASVRRRGQPTVSGKRVVLVVVIGPLVVAGIITAFVYAYRNEKGDPRPPIGSGAGHTGMYNEYSGNAAKPAGTGAR